MNNHYIPNSAHIPNILLDYWMPRLNSSAFKILMAIARKTYGWNKEKDAISLRQLEEMTSLCKSGIIKNIQDLVNEGIVIKIKSKSEKGDDASNKYKINLDFPQIDAGTGGPNNIQGVVHLNEVCTKNEPPNAKKIDNRSPPIKLPVVHKMNTQNTLIQNTLIQKEESVSDPASPSGLSVFFFEKLKEINPKIKPPNFKKWTQELERLQSRDERSEQEIKDVINFIVEQHKNPTRDFTWSKAVASPEKLRKHFAAIWLEMTNSPSIKKFRKDQEDRLIAEKVINLWGKPGHISLSCDYIEFIYGVNSPSVCLSFGAKDFKEKLCKQLDYNKLDSRRILNYI